MLGQALDQVVCMSDEAMSRPLAYRPHLQQQGSQPVMPNPAAPGNAVPRRVLLGVISLV